MKTIDCKNCHSHFEITSIKDYLSKGTFYTTSSINNSECHYDEWFICNACMEV